MNRFTMLGSRWRRPIRMQINCLGRRSILVEKIGDKIGLAIIWKGERRLATLQLKKDDALKLVGELNEIIRFDNSK